MEVANAYATATDLPPLSPHEEAPLDTMTLADEEFTEADVLPFLLQAQDIIAKLESRVVELETDLSSIHRKYEHDRHDWLVGLSQKDQFIHHLSSKLQKLEFNGKQAIVLLNDCIDDSVDVDITSTLSLCLSYLRNTNTTTTTSMITKEHQPLPQEQTAIIIEKQENCSVDDDDALEEGELERRQAAANEWKQRQPVRSLSTATTGTTAGISSWQPVNLMDGIDSSSHGNSIDGSDSSRVETDSSITTTTTTNTNTLHAVPGGGDVFSSNTSLSSMSRLPSEIMLQQHYHHDDTNVQLQFNTSNDNNNNNNNDVDDDGEDDEDHPMRRPPPSMVMTLPTSTLDHCANCKQLLTQLDQQIEQKAYLKRDLSALASALAEEEQVRESIEQARLDLIEDIQDITSSLFGALNQVVMDEVTDREGLLRLNRDLDGALVNVLQSWDVRDQRLKQIKELLVDLDASAHQTTTTERSLSIGQLDDHLLRSTHTLHHQQQEQQQQQSSSSPFHQRQQHQMHSRTPSVGLSTLDEPLYFDKSTIRLDGVHFREFQSHLKALTAHLNSKKQSLTATTVALPSTTFMKRVTAEDVEPCLFQNNGTSWWRSPWFKRKLMDAIANNKCEIQHAVRPLAHGTGVTTQTTTTLSSSSTCSTSTSSPSIASSEVPMPPKTKCTCCGLLRVCEFKMRLHHPSSNTTAASASSSPSSSSLLCSSPLAVLQKHQQQQQHQQMPLQTQQQQQQPWLPIDRFCRDRLVAVCDFYGFLSQLPQAVRQNTPVLVMFKQSLLFRRKMALAKVGSVGLFTNNWDYAMESASASSSTSSSGLRSSMRRQSGSMKRRSRSSKRESIVLDHSGNASDTGSVVSLSDIQGLDGTSQIVIVH